MFQLLICRDAKRKDLARWFREPTISEILSDSLVQAVMEADGVDPQVLEFELRTLAEQLPFGPRLAPHRRVLLASSSAKAKEDDSVTGAA